MGRVRIQTKRTGDGMKLALYTFYGDTSVYEAESWREKDDDYTRISEVVEVEFEAIVADQTGAQT